MLRRIRKDMVVLQNLTQPVAGRARVAPSPPERDMERRVEVAPPPPEKGKGKERRVRVVPSPLGRLMAWRARVAPPPPAEQKEEEHRRLHQGRERLSSEGEESWSTSWSEWESGQWGPWVAQRAHFASESTGSGGCTSTPVAAGSVGFTHTHLCPLSREPSPNKRGEAKANGQRG